MPAGMEPVVALLCDVGMVVSARVSCESERAAEVEVVQLDVD